jgi:predicted esterase
MARIGASAAALIMVACGSTEADDRSSASASESAPTDTQGDDADETSGGADGATSSTDDPDDQPGADTDGGDDADPPDTGPPTGYGLCHTAPPEGAPMPPPLPAYSGGACPALAPGHNTITSSNAQREFLLVVPTDLQASERLPVVFLWHWLGGSAQAFLNNGDVQNAVNELRFAAVIPEHKGDLATRWPYTVVDSNARFEEEYRFFDDMLACVAEAYPIEASCIGSAGVSAGALFTGQLGSGRGQLLSSIMSLSGGTGGVIRNWGGSPNKMPAFVLWGGPNDTCGPVNFQETSLNLEAALSAQGHLVLECLHNCGHASPPFDQPPTTTEFAPLWKFFLDHPYWLDTGTSPWQLEGMPDGMPPWCSIGAGTAAMRMGECGPSQC